MAVERAGAASLRGNPFTVIGAELKPGDAAPNFNLVGAGMSHVSLKDTAGKVQSKVGELTGSTEQQAKGMAKQVEGKTQKKIGNAKEVVKDSVRKL